MPERVIKINVVFVKSKGLLSFIIRVFTRRHGQAIRDVPSHTLAIVQNMRTLQRYLYESTIKGVHVYPLSIANYLDLKKTIVSEIDITPYAQITPGLEYLNSKIGERYGWWSIFLKYIDIHVSGLIKLLKLPIEVDFKTKDNGSLICSEYMQQFEEVSDINVDYWLTLTGNSFTSPTTPNDLMLATKACYEHHDWKNYEQHRR